AIYLPGVSLIPIQRPLVSTLFPYTTLFRSLCGQTPGWAHLPRPEFPAAAWRQHVERRRPGAKHRAGRGPHNGRPTARIATRDHRSEEHTSELQSRENLVCRLLLEKKKNTSA